MPNTTRTIAGGARSREPALSVVVPATDRPPTLGRCLDAIHAAAGPLDEVIVVDEPAPLGPAAARNAGVRRASREAIVFVDSDVEVQADALERIRAALAPSSGLDAVFGSYDDAPAERGIVSLFRNLLHHHVHQSSAGPATTFWAGLGAIRHSSFLELGGFDARRYRRASIEDIDLGVRLATGGGRILLDPMIRGRHLKRWTLPGLMATDFARRGAPWVALRLRTRTGSTDLNLGWRHRLSALTCAAAAVGAVRRPGAALRRPTTALLLPAGLLALNRSFYALLVRRVGVSGMIAGVALHALHHLTAAASVPAGVLLHLLDRPDRTLHGA